MATKLVTQNAPSGGELKLEFDHSHTNAVFMHVSSGGFSYCHMFTGEQAKAMAEAFQKGAFLIEQNTPVAEAA